MALAVSIIRSPSADQSVTIKLVLLSSKQSPNWIHPRSLPPVPQGCWGCCWVENEPRLDGGKLGRRRRQPPLPPAASLSTKSGIHLIHHRMPKGIDEFPRDFSPAIFKRQMKRKSSIGNYFRTPHIKYTTSCFCFCSTAKEWIMTGEKALWYMASSWVRPSSIAAKSNSRAYKRLFGLSGGRE